METGFQNIRVETDHHQPQTVTNRNPERNPERILRVAVYARVSTLKEAQEDSFETQCAYYQKLISSTPGMKLVGIYGDQGVSGLSTKGRSGFASLMQDCRNGKIDCVITRSVSRLSRNMAECVETVNQLKDLGIPIRFEKEGLTTTDPGSELFFHILATLAQEESGSTSRRITWALERRAELGSPARKCPYGYRKAENGAWVIDETQANRVRKAFAMAAELYCYREILEELNRMEQAEGTGAEWQHDRLYRMLRNEVYRGDVLTHKTYIVDYVTKKQKINRGERTRYYVREHHEPTVPPELYERVQSLMDAGLLHSAAYNARCRHLRSAAQWRNEEAGYLARKAFCKRREKQRKNAAQGKR